MRYFFLCFLFFTTTCFAQHKGKRQQQTDTTTNAMAPNQEVKSDTTKAIKNDTAKAVTYLSAQSQDSKEIYINDTTFFAIHFLGNGYETILMGNKKNFVSDKELDDFITLNKPVINTKKIFIIKSPLVSFEKIKPVLEILRAHQYYEFKILAE
jgi:hypothetical protein